MSAVRRFGLACVWLCGACTTQSLDLIVTADGGTGDANGGSALRVQVEVNFSQSTGKQSRAEQYGLTLVRGSEPTSFGSPGNETYKQNLALMRPGSVRFAGALINDSTQPGGWVKNAELPSPSWDRARIAAALTNDLRATKVITLPRWPVGFAPQDQPLPASLEAQFASFCADLVRITNNELKQNVRYFEVFSEIEPVYAGQGARLGSFVAQIAVAIKAVDPSVAVGGSGFINAYSPELPEFIAAAGDAIDFVSYHGYATGDANAPLAQILDAGASLASQTDRLAGLAKNKVPALQVLQTQWNINWNPDERMNNHVGAVFDALALAAFARSNTALATAWNESDGWYGKLSEAHVPRLSAHVFRLFNELLVGNIMESSASEPQAVSVMAVLAAGRRRVLLVNESEEPRLVRIAPALPFVSNSTTVSERGVTEAALGKGVSSVELPRLSVTVIAEP